MCCWLYEPYSKSSFKFCSIKLDSPCPTTQNSLRLAALPSKNIKKNSTRRMGFSNEVMFLPFEGWLFRRN